MPLYLVDIHDPLQTGTPRVERRKHEADEWYLEGHEFDLDGQRMRVIARYDEVDSPYDAHLLCHPV